MPELDFTALYEAELAHCSSCDPMREAQLRVALGGGLTPDEPDEPEGPAEEN